MTTKTSGGILTSILRRARGIFFAPRSSSNPIENEEYITEHFLLYHGLAGTSPENQREFRDVRADIRSALEAKSTVQLTIALKLPPLWWADRLKSIADEIEKDGNMPDFMNLLMPSDETADRTSRQDPLASDSWQSRANAAILIANAGETRAVPHLITCMNECLEGSLMPAFCHVINALSLMGTAEAMTAISEHLTSEEPWFRVDATSALSNWSTEEAAHTLMDSMTDWHTFSDYQAVAIARKHKPATLFGSKNSTAGALMTIIGVLEASYQTYSPDIVVETEIPYCWPDLVKSVRNSPDCRIIHATTMLADWLTLHADIYSHRLPHLPADIDEQLNSFKEWLNSKEVEDLILGRLESPNREELRHTFKLIEQLKITRAAPALIPFLNSKEEWLDSAIQAAGSLGDVGLTDKLVELAESLVDMEHRCGLPRNKLPVAERDSHSAQRYWLILKALGSVPTKRASAFLLAATNDYAPDKRQQAFQSLTCSYRSSNPDSKTLSEIQTSIREGLRDPSAAVRTSAVEAVGHFNFTDLIAETVKLVDAKEVSLRKEAFRSLRTLRDSGAEKAVNQAIKGKVTGELDPFKRDRLEKFLKESAS